MAGGSILVSISHSVKNNPAPIAKGKRILIVDDDPEMGEALAEVLVDEGYSVGRAGNGAQSNGSSTKAVLCAGAMSA